MAETERLLTGPHRGKKPVTRGGPPRRLLGIDVREQLLILRRRLAAAIHHINIEVDERETLRARDDFANNVDVELGRVGLLPRGDDIRLAGFPRREDGGVRYPVAVHVDAVRPRRREEADRAVVIRDAIRLPGRAYGAIRMQLVDAVERVHPPILCDEKPRTGAVRGTHAQESRRLVRAGGAGRGTRPGA